LQKIEDKEKDEIKKQNFQVKQILRYHLDELGPMTYEEKSVSVAFLMLVSFWFFRAPGFMTGWGDVLTEKFAEDPSKEIKISDSTAAIVIIALLFSLPKEVIIKICYHISIFNNFVR
jgi:sodium-dependent dicarboxylate transporter 2/3/5